jgi:DNA-binding transcriptional MerR regulator
LKKGHYSVRAAAAIAGLTPATLRIWEARYQVVTPQRSESGHRRYDQAAVQRLQMIAALVRQGHAIGSIASLDDAALQALLSSSRAEASSSALPDAVQSRLQALSEAIANFELAPASNQLKWLKTALGARSFVLDVAVPLFARVGQLVAGDKLDVSQEHALSAVLRDQIGDMLYTLQGLSVGYAATERAVVFASPEDDLHEFGILLGAVLAAVRGLPVWYAGANLPAVNLAVAVKGVQARAIVLGNAPVPASDRRVSFEEFLLELDGRVGKSVPIIVGGQGDRPRSALPSKRRFTYVNSLEELDDLLGRMEVDLRAPGAPTPRKPTSKQ